NAVRSPDRDPRRRGAAGAAAPAGRAHRAAAALDRRPSGAPARAADPRRRQSLGGGDWGSDRTNLAGLRSAFFSPAQVLTHAGTVSFLQRRPIAVAAPGSCLAPAPSMR